MIRKMTMAVALLLAGAVWAQAQEVAYTWIQFHRVHLRNGNFLEGNMVSRTQLGVTLKQPWGDIVIRNDQIDRIEFVKMKSIKDPIILIDKKDKGPLSPSTEISAKPSKLATETPADKMLDSADPVPSSIPASVVKSVDQAIALWKTAISGEKQDLTDALTVLGAEITPYLQFLLEHRSQSTPLAQVSLAFATLDEDAYIPFSERMMASRSSEVREAVITALSKTSSAKRLPIMLAAMEDSFPSVWKIAMDTLLAAAKRDSEKSELIDAISSRIRGSKNNTAFAVALARIGGNQARDVLWNLVNDADETNRMTGLHGLGIIADPEDGDKLVTLLHDRSVIVRKGTCLALGKIKVQRAAIELVGLLREDDPGLTKNARWALTEITGQRVPDNNEAWIDWWEQIGSKVERFSR